MTLIVSSHSYELNARAQVPVTDNIWAALTALVDLAYMRLYAEVSENTRRMTRLVVAMLPLIVLLVGSCNTAEITRAYGAESGPDRLRTALFPDRISFKGMDYYPAEGYVARAREYVSADPDSLQDLTEEEVQFLFGAPRFQRKDADARIWQYQDGTSGCVVDFYFYDTGRADDGRARVSYVDLRTNSGAKTSTVEENGRGNCLTDVMSEGDFTSQRI